MQQTRKGRGRRGLSARPATTYLTAALILFALAALAPAASGSIVVGTLTIPLPITVPGLSPAPAQATTPVKAKKKPKKAKAHIAAVDPFQARGMWIWELGASNGGSLSSIITQAQRYQVKTLYIKSSDGTGMWAQFTRALVSRLHHAGIKVCAWQFVYGVYPRYEALAGADAVKDGADCLVIDAEGQYDGLYYQAQEYVQRLRQLIGASFPVALAGLPYVNDHPGFPYSVFLGPGGAQYNMPQMYWYDIGTSVATVYADTYLFNRPYLRPISPLGQTFEEPPTSQIQQFRQFYTLYKGTGISWWDWQDATSADWRAVSEWVPNLADASAVPGEATISDGWAGDIVIWAQEHLVAAGQKIAIDGGFGPQTLAAVKRFQRAHGLTVDGVIGTQTWSALLRYKAYAVTWAKPTTTNGARIAAARRRITPAEVARADNASAAKPSVNGTTPVPLSALLPSTHNELSGTPGAGRP